jgi:hypothetical protein
MTTMNRMESLGLRWSATQFPKAAAREPLEEE